MNAIRSAIDKLVRNRDLEDMEAENVMRQIMSGDATPAQIGAFLSAMRIKRETPSEIAAFARVMRRFADGIEPNVDDIMVDVCGTGGDSIDTFNISTSAMFVAAGAGVYVAKHGNRSVTSKSGSADVLESLGVNIDPSPERVKSCIEDIGIGFMFAPKFHEAMRYAIGPRKEVGLRTAFNVLGPLTNPAGAEAQLMGVYDPNLTRKLAEVLNRLGCERAMVVHGMKGLDEISNLGRTRISGLADGDISTYELEPEDLGLSRASQEEIAGGDPEENAEILLRILKGERGPRRDVILMNAAASILLARKANSLERGVELARRSIDSGGALSKLEELIEVSRGDLNRLRSLEESI